MQDYKQGGLVIDDRNVFGKVATLWISYKCTEPHLQLGDG